MYIFSPYHCLLTWLLTLLALRSSQRASEVGLVLLYFLPDPITNDWS